MKKRTVALLCAAVALLGVIFGGTMAWLTRGSDAVVNTFTTASVGLTLEETTGPYIMAPGADLPKDPKVYVYEDSASCYLFVKVEEQNFGETAPITWEAAPGWTKVDLEQETVYYRVFDETKTDEYTQDEETGMYVFPFLKDDQVQVSDTLTKAYMSDLKESGEGSYPVLKFTAYAIQKDYLKDSNGKELTEESVKNIWALANQKTVPDSEKT